MSESDPKLTWKQRNPEKNRAQVKAYRERNREKVRATKARYRMANLEKVKKRCAEWKARNKERIKLVGAARYAENKARILASLKKYVVANREKVRGRMKNWYNKNREKQCERSRKFRKEHPDVCRKQLLDWASRNPEKVKAHRAKRRARRQNAVIGDTSIIAAWEKKWKSKARVKCYWCRRSVPSKDCHTDHVTPLVKSGPHSVENLCISCPSCNLKKGPKTIDSWNEELLQPVLL